MAQRAGSRKGRASARASGMSTKAGSRTEAPAPSATPRPWALVSALAVIALLASFTPFAIAQTRACDGEACRVNRNHTIEIYNLMANDFNQTEFEQALVAAANLTGASVVQVTVREADTVCDSGTPTGFDARTDPITRSTCSQERRRRNATMPSPPPPPSTTTMTSNTTAMPATMASNSTTVPATMPSNMTTTASNTTMPSNSTAMPATTAVNATTTTTTTTTTTMDPCTCAENQYVVEACNPTQNITNATCADCSTCDAGQFVATNCRGMTDTQCGNCTDGTFQSMTAHLEMSCKPCTDTCGSGTFLASACTRTMDTQCSACPDNTFQSADSHNLTSCTTCDTCTAGEFAFLQCTPTSNILCNNCTGFTYQDLLMHNSSTCKDCSMCGQGQFVADACTATTNTNCSACTGATFQNMTSHYEMECQACSMCGQGTFLAMACNRTSDAMCSACQNGTYQDSSSHLEEQCKQCGRCDPGQRLLSPCTATSNTSCVACDSGTWQNATGHLDPTCMMCSKCGLGQKLTTNCTLTANTVCTTCEDGTFQDTDDHTLESCTACRTCTAGEEFESSPCAASADRACDPITTCDPRYSRERYAPTPTSDRVCLDFRKAAVTVVVQVDTLETEIDATRAAIEAAIQDGSNGPLARELRKLDDAAYNNTEVTYLPQVSRFDVPSEGRQFVYLDLQFAASSTQFDIQKLDLLDVLDAFLLNATEDADATATFMERSTVSTTTTNTTTNATTTTYSTTALFRVDVDAALTITTDALNAMAAAIDAANTTSLQRTAGPTPNGEPVMFIPCEPCRSTTHPGLYQELGFCGGLCLQCTECSLDQYLTNVCEGTSDAQCNALPTEFETAPPVNVIGVNTNHILPTAASQQQDQAMDASMRVNRSFVFTNIAPGESTWVAVSGEPEDGAQMVTRPLAPAAQVDCAPVLDNVYATYPTAQVVLAALDASGHSRVARTNVTVRFVAADDEDAEVTATCTMPTDGPAVCNAWTTFADAWFSSAGPRLVDVTFKYTTPRADGEGYETSPDMACGQLTLGPTQQEVLGVSSSIAAVVTPTNSVFENDTVDVAVIARHDWAVHSFGVSLRCGNCRIEMSEANTAAWSISSTVTTDEESGEQMLVVAGIARDLTDEPKFSEQRSFSLFTATVHAVPAAEDSMLVLRGNIDSFLQVRNRRPIVDTRTRDVKLPVLANDGSGVDATSWTQPILAIEPVRAHVFVGGGLGVVFDTASITDATTDLPVSLVGVWPRGDALRNVANPETDLVDCQLVDMSAVLDAVSCSAVSLAPFTPQDMPTTDPVELQLSVGGMAAFGTANIMLMRPASKLTIAPPGDISSDTTVVLRPIREVNATSNACADVQFMSSWLQVSASFPNGVTLDVTGIAAMTTSNSNVATIDTATSVVSGVGAGSASFVCTNNHDCADTTISVMSDVPAVALGVRAYAVGGATFTATINDAGNLWVSAAVSVSSSNLLRFTSSANAARLHVAAVVMEQVTDNRQQLALAPAAVAFASDNTDVATVAQSNDDPATVTTTATSGLAAITAQWPKATCARKTFEAAVNVTTTDATVVSIAVSPTSVDLVVPFANAGAAEAVTGLPSSAAFTVTRTLSDGSVETVTSASFTSADENCGDFTGMLALETDAVASECTYTTVDGDLMASVTVNKYALGAVRMTVTARGVEGSATHTSGAAAAEQFEVPQIGAGATAWPALTASCVAVFNTTKQDMAVTVQLRQVATMAQAVFASRFTAANDDQQDQEDAALALQPADASLQITTSIAGNATLSATFGGLTATTAVLFAAGDDASLPLSVTGASVADVVANANGTFPLLGRVNATFTLDIAAEVTGEPLSPGQVRLDDGSLAIRSLVTFTSSNTDALSVDAHGIITLHDGSATEVTIGIAVNGTVQATVTCLPSLLPAEGAGSFGPHGVSAASFSRVRVPLHVEAENLRAAVLSLTYDPALLALATVELGSDVQFAFLDFNVRTPGELSVFVVIPGNAITSDDLELGVAVFTTRNLTTTSPQLSLGGSVVEVDANGNPSLVELDATTSSLFVETTPMMMTRRRRSSLTSDGAADLELDAAAMVANTLARRRRSGPRGTLTTVLANHPTFDMNGDGVLDVLDVLMLSDVYSGRLTENDLAEGADADTNSDGIVSFDDVSFLLSLAAGRLVALRRVAVTTVQAADSDCMLSFNVSVLLTNITLSTPEADDTRLYLDVAGVASSSDFDATFAAASTAPGPNFKFVRIPYARTNRTEDTGAYFLQASTPLASSDQLGVSVLQVDGSGAYNFHTRQDMIVNNTLDASFDVDGTNVSLFLPFGYAPIRAFTNTMDTPTCLAQRRPVITDFTRPDPDAMNVVDGYLLLLDWTAPPTPPNAITRYFVQYRDLNVTGAPVIEKSVDGNTLHLDLTDQILPYHTYEVQVQAEFGNRRSVISTPATAQTHQDTPNMPPQLDAIAVINATAVNVTWTPLDETDLNGVVQYLVLVQRLDDEPNADPNAPSQFVRTVDHPASSIVFTGLEESVKYNVTIQARTNVDTGFAISATEFYLPAIVFETDDAPPDLPPAVVSIVPSDTSFTITWEAPPPETHNSDLVAYLVRVRRAANTTYADNTTITDADFGGADDWHVFRYSAQTFTKDFTTLESGDPLHPAIVYEFQMQTEGSMSSLLSPWSETYTVRLLESAPTGNVTNTDVTTTSSSLMVEWQLPEPLERKGLITNFTIVYSRQDDDPRVATDSLDNCPASVCNSFVPANGDVVYTWPLVGLEAYVTYTVEVRAWTSAGIGPAATFVIRTDEAIPSAPVVFGDVSVTPRTVDIDFDPLPVPDRNGIAAYTATLTISTDPFYTQRIDSALAASLPVVTEFENQPNSTLTFQATGLQPFMEYTLEVVPHTSVGDGEANTITVLTEEETPTAPAITNVQVLADDTAQEKRVRVSVNIRPLNRRNGVLQNLTIEYGNDAFGDLATLQTPLTSAERATTTVSRVIDGLRAGVLYSFTATVTNRAPVSPESPTSPSFSKTTDEYIPTGPVLNLVAAEETDETDASKRVLLTWNPPTLATRNGIITEYRVVVRVTPNQQAQAQVHSDLTYSLAELGSNNQGDGLSTRFTSLGAYDKYTFSVTPLTAIGEGTDTTTVSTPDNNGILSPALPGASVGQLTTTKGTTTLDVSWNALAVSDWNDASLQYRVILTQLADDHSDTPAEHVVATQETSTTSVSFSGLQEYVQYKVDVYPINSVFVGMEQAGGFDASALLTTNTVRTEAAPPAATPVITDRSNDAHSITVQWGRIAMHDFNGPPRHYVVSYKGLAVDYVENGGQSATSPELDATDVIVPYDASEENPSVTLTDLEPNRMYEIKVAPENTEFAPGPFSATESVQTWSFRPAELPTVQFHDDRPNGESKQTTLRITWPIINTRFGPVRQVQVIVEPEGSRQFNTMYNCTSASGEDECAFGGWETSENARVNKQTPRAYIAVQRLYTGDDATQTSGSLVVGDELNYGGFFNGPLRPGTTYTVRLRAFTQSSDGNEMFDTVGTISEPVYDEKGRLISSPQASTTTSSSSGGSPVGIIAGGASATALVLIVLVVVILQACRSGTTKTARLPAPTNDGLMMTANNPTFSQPGQHVHDHHVYAELSTSEEEAAAARMQQLRFRWNPAVYDIGPVDGAGAATNGDTLGTRLQGMASTRTHAWEPHTFDVYGGHGTTAAGNDSPVRDEEPAESAAEKTDGAYDTVIGVGVGGLPESQEEDDDTAGEEREESRKREEGQQLAQLRLKQKDDESPYEVIEGFADVDMSSA